MRKIYLDDAATSRVVPEVLKAMEPFFLEDYGNPSSLHEMGEKVEKAMNEARKKLAGEIGARAHEIVFTSGATESNNMAIFGLTKVNKKKNKIIISSIEHPSVNEVCNYLESKRYKIVRIKVDRGGQIDLDHLEKEIDDNTAIVSVIHANNIIGSVQDLEKIGKICKNMDVPFHTDVTQSFGKLEIDVQKMNIRLLSANAHKIGGPKGVGLLYVKENLKMEPMMHGGGQEKGLRSGTENVPGIVGFAKALEICKKIDKDKVYGSRIRLMKGLEGIGGRIISPKNESALGNIVNVSFSGIENETLVVFLSQKGIYVSAGSACDSKKSKEDHLLKAIGLNKKEIDGNIRISLNEKITEEDVDYVVSEIGKGVERLRV